MSDEARKGPRQIVLVGLSGVGKTAVGRVIAGRLGWPFLDTDELVLEREGRTPADIITESGELAFRRVEERVVADAAAQVPAVIATGGGAFLAPRARRLLARTGYICYLDATPSEIARRLRAAGDRTVRPLLGEDVEGRLQTLDAERRAYYMHADLWVPVQGVTADEAASRILAAWAREGAQMLARPHRLERLAAEHPPRGPAALVDAEGLRSPVWVGRGELRRLPDRLRQLELDEGRVFLVSDQAVMEAHGKQVAGVLDGAGIPGASYLVPPGEASKRMAVARELYAWLAAQRAERGDVIVALGGGVVCDLAGFVAATYLRGMPLVQLPTSVLAMNDAAIGGKVAVDLPEGKNLVGAFHQPRAVIADIDTLATLPRRAYIEGYAEVIKHGLILDPGLLAMLEREYEALTSGRPDWDRVAEVTARSTRLKALVVSADPRERGLRTILNYGHTVGHAIESASGYRDHLHGEAVSVGMMAAGRIGVELGVTDDELLARQADVLRHFGLPLTASGLEPEAVIEAMALDKKVQAGRQRFVLLDAPGHAVVRDDVPPDAVGRAVREVLVP